MSINDWMEVLQYTHGWNSRFIGTFLKNSFKFSMWSKLRLRKICKYFYDLGPWKVLDSYFTAYPLIWICLMFFSWLKLCIFSNNTTEMMCVFLRVSYWKAYDISLLHYWYCYLWSLATVWYLLVFPL